MSDGKAEIFPSLDVSLESVIVCAEGILQHIGDGPGNDARLRELLFRLNEWERANQQVPDGNASRAVLIQGSVEMLSGRLLIEAAHAAASKESGSLKTAIQPFRQLQKHHLDSLNFEQALLQVPAFPATSSEALALFQSRAASTLDNMVDEAADIVSNAWGKFSKNFQDFSNQLSTLADSLTSKETTSFLKVGVEKVIEGIRKFAAYFNSTAVQEVAEQLKELFHVDVKLVLSEAFGCAARKARIHGLDSASTKDQPVYVIATEELTRMSSQYVALLEKARWAITGIGIAGPFLMLTGVGASHVALATPVAYALVCVATVLIGMEFAGPKFDSIVGTL